MDHQKRGLDRVLKEKNLLLAAEAGTGKTLVALALAQEVQKDTIVIAPKFLLNNWRREASKWGLEKELDRFHFLSHHDVRTNPLPKKPGAILIVDESHFCFGNTQSKAYKSLMKWIATYKPAYRLLLTGTPIRTKASDIYGQLTILGYDECRSFWAFLDRYCLLEPAFRGSSAKKEVGVRSALEFAALLKPWVMKVKLRDVLKLTEVRSEHINLDLKEDKQLKELSAALTVSELQRALCEHSRGVETKLTIAKAKAVALASSGLLDTLTGQVIIFSDHPGALEYLYKSDKCGTLKTKSKATINAKVSGPLRSAIASDFTSGKIDRLYVNIRCGGTGLNLQTAQYVVFNDLSYTPAENVQALARAQRHGRTTGLVVYYLYAGFHDEHLGTLLNEKQKILGETIESP